MRRLKVALDCDVPDRLAPVLTSLYGHKGFDFYPVTEFAAGSSTDDHWADAFKRFGGHVTLSADGQIAYKPHKVLAFIDNKFMSFFFASPWQQSPGHVKASHAIYWWPAIEQKIIAAEFGKCWRIPCDLKIVGGRFVDVRLTPTELEPLLIPDDILERARGERQKRTTNSDPKKRTPRQNGRQGGLGV